MFQAGRKTRGWVREGQTVKKVLFALPMLCLVILSRAPHGHCEGSGCLIYLKPDRISAYLTHFTVSYAQILRRSDCVGCILRMTKPDFSLSSYT